MRAFVSRNYQITLFSMGAFQLVLAVHFALALAVPSAAGLPVAGADLQLAVATGVLMCLLLAYMAWLRWSDVPRRHFEALNVCTTVLIGYGLLVALNSARELVMLVFPVFAYVVAAVRWLSLIHI